MCSIKWDNIFLRDGMFNSFEACDSVTIHDQPPVASHTDSAGLKTWFRIHIWQRAQLIWQGLFNIFRMISILVALLPHHLDWRAHSADRSHTLGTHPDHKQGSLQHNIDRARDPHTDPNFRNTVVVSVLIKCKRCQHKRHPHDPHNVATGSRLLRQILYLQLGLNRQWFVGRLDDLADLPLHLFARRRQLDGLTPFQWLQRFELFNLI